MFATHVYKLNLGFFFIFVGIAKEGEWKGGGIDKR